MQSLHRQTQAAAGRALVQPACHNNTAPWLAEDPGRCPPPHLSPQQGVPSTCCCACCSSMKWELANWSSWSRRLYLSGAPVLHFWPPLSPSSACEREGETSGYFLSKSSITDEERSTAHHGLPQVRLHSGLGWCLCGPIQGMPGRALSPHSPRGTHKWDLSH